MNWQKADGDGGVIWHLHGLHIPVLGVNNWSEGLVISVLGVNK